jgi:CheY-like chemotaxis protein
MRPSVNAPVVGQQLISQAGQLQMSAKRSENLPGPTGAILIADDDQNDVDYVSRDLRRMGLPHLIHTVPNGEQVIAYLRGEGPFADRVKFPYPNILLLDLRMEPMDGFAVLRWLKDNSHLKTFPILVLTGLSERHDLTEAYRLGATTFLTKPAALSDLKETFHALKVLPCAPE